MEDYYSDLILNVFHLTKNQDLTPQGQREKVKNILRAMKEEEIQVTTERVKKKCINAIENLQTS
jgi:hypothetical protein